MIIEVPRPPEKVYHPISQKTWEKKWYPQTVADFYNTTVQWGTPGKLNQIVQQAPPGSRFLYGGWGGRGSHIWNAWVEPNGTVKVFDFSVDKPPSVKGYDEYFLIPTN